MADAIERAESDLERHTDAGGRGTEHGQAAAAGHQPPAGKKKDKTGLLVALSAAGVVVAFLTYRAMRGGGGAAAANTGPYSSAGDAGNYPSTGQVAGSSGDPNAGAGFETMIANLEAQVGALQTSVSAIPTTPSSSSSGTTASKSPHAPATTSSGKPRFEFKKGLHYIRDKGGTGSIYQVQANGQRAYVTAAEWAEVQSIDPSAAKHIVFYGHRPPPHHAAPKKPPHKPPTKGRK